MVKPFKFFHTKISVEDTGRPISILSGQTVDLFNCDIQIQNNPVSVGDRHGQDLQLSVGDIYSNPLPNIPVSTNAIWVKNRSAGNTGVIVVTGWFE